MNNLSIQLPPSTSQPGKLRMTGRSPKGHRIAMNNLCLLRDGKPWLPSMGEFHYSRYPARLWEEELLKIRAGGVEIVPTYAFWNHHEEEEGVFDFTGCRDLRRFVQLCGRLGLWVMMRVGPFCHGEVRNGGLPDWLYGRGFELRCNDRQYLRYVRRLYGEYGKQLKGLMFKDGGPIMGLQCENEFMDSAAPWETTQNPAMAYTPKGSGGAAHLMRLKRLAKAAGMDAPLQTCTGWGASPIDPTHFLPMFGGYGYYSWIDDPAGQDPTGFFLFRDMPRRASDKFDPRSVPFACCEIGGGIQVFYKNRPVVPPESVEAMHIAQLGSGSNLMGYYVYHGGANPAGKHSFLNEHHCPRISYDFQAPLSEFGRARPHYHMLRRQFLFLQAFGQRLAPMQVSLTPEVAACKPTDTTTVRWAVRSDGRQGFLFVSNFQDHVEMPAQRGLSFTITTTDGEVLSLPAAFTLQQSVACILPLNFSMDGLLLKSATLQPLTRIENDGTPHYFFFVPRGMPAQYAFESATFTVLEAPRARVRQAKDQTLVSVEPGTANPLRFVLPGGRKVLVSTLTEEQSRMAYLAPVAGRPHLFLSQATLLFRPRAVELRHTDPAQLALAVYPPLPARRATRRDGLFSVYTLSPRRRRISLAVRKLGAGKLAVRLPRQALSGTQEVYLQIDYVGDTGSAYLGGKLIHDHFWNGTTWEIGLRRFAPQLQREELVLVLTPLRKQGGAKVQYTSMAAMTVVADGEAMEFRSVHAIVEYSRTLPLR